MSRFPLLMAALALTAFAKNSPDLKKPKVGEVVRVIAQYRVPPGQAKHDKITKKGGKIHKKFDFMNAALYEVTPEALDDLLKDADVDYVTPDRAIANNIDSMAQSSANFWDVINFFNNNWQNGYLRGAGMSVAVIDSGVANHKNLMYWDEQASRVAYHQSFVDTSTADLYGHGTHVAGIIASSDILSKSYSNGILHDFWAPALEARVISLKALNSNGQGTDSAVISAIDRAIQLKSTYNIRVMNLSLGRPIYESYTKDPLCQAVERAWRAGIVVIVSAGNHGRENINGSNGYGTITSPANDPLVITVGAVNHKNDWDINNDTVTSYSSKGPTFIDRIVKPDLVVPGSHIFSLQAPNSKLATTFPENRPLNNQLYTGGDSTASPNYIKLHGTSMAAPLVSAGALLMLSKDANLTPDQIKFRMMKTAWRGFPRTATSVFDATTNKWYTVNHDIFTIGAGMLNLGAAFWSTELPTGTAASPKAYYDTATKRVRLQYNTSTNVLWGDNTQYPANVLWGDNVSTSGNNVLWGDNVVWGSSTLTGFNVVWGSTSTWSAGVSGLTDTQTLGKGE